MTGQFGTTVVLCCLSWGLLSFGAQTPQQASFGDKVPTGICGGETPQFYSRYAQAGSPSEFKPAYLHAGIKAVPGWGGFSNIGVGALKDITVPSDKNAKTLLALNFPESGYPSSMFAYKVGNCQDKWTNDFFCDKPFCECPHTYGEWTADVADPATLDQATYKGLAQDKKDYIAGIYKNVRDVPAEGTSGKWQLVSVSVYRTSQQKMFTRFNYKLQASTEEQYLAVSVPIQKDESKGNAGLVDWMCAVMGQFCGKCFAGIASSTATITTTMTTTTATATITPPRAKTKITFQAVDVFQYAGKCVTTPGAQAVTKAKRFSGQTARRACKVECMSENTDGVFSGGVVLHANGGGSKCEGYSFNPTIQTGSNCILYQESRVQPQPTPAATTTEPNWECWKIEMEKQIEHKRSKQELPSHYTKTYVNKLHTTAKHSDAKYFNPFTVLNGGYMAKRYKVHALDQTAADAYFSPYMWVELEGSPSVAGGRRLGDQFKLDNNFWWQQIWTGAGAGYIPVSAQEWDKLALCVAVTGADMTPAHVVTTERICVDTTAGYCIQQVLELTWLWPLLAAALLCFIIGYLCRPGGNYQALEFDVTVSPTKPGRGGYNLQSGVPLTIPVHT